MFCPNCGTNVPEGANACPNCGTFLNAAPAAPEAPVYQAPPVQQPYYNAAPVYQAAPVGGDPALAKSILVFGILAIAFASSFYLSFLGIIFGAIAAGKVKAYTAQGGVIAGKAKVGRILGKVGLILGIVLSVILVIYIIIVAVAAASYSAFYY